MRNKRRRRNQSPWLEALQDLRAAKKSKREHERSSYEPDTHKQIGTVLNTTASKIRDREFDETDEPYAHRIETNANSPVTASREFEYKTIEENSSNMEQEVGIFGESSPNQERSGSPCHGEALNSTLLTEVYSASNAVQEAEDPSAQQQSINSQQIVATALPSTSHSDQNIEDEPDMEALECNLRMWNEHLNLAAMIAVVGSVRYTVEQYDYTRSMLKDVGLGVTWPSYWKTQKHFDNIINTVLPKSRLVRLLKKASLLSQNHEGSGLSDCESQSPDLELETRDQNQGIAEERRNNMEQVRIFFPSSWAKLDVSTSITFQEMYPSFENGDYAPSPLDDADIVQDRDSITRTCDQIYVEFQGTVVAAGSADVITLTVVDSAPVSIQDTTNCKMLTPDSYSLSGSILVTWCVGAQENVNPSFNRAINSANLTRKERSMITHFSTAPGPHDISTPREGPRPGGVLPGDICTLLRIDVTRELFSVLVHRYWRHEDGLPSMILMWPLCPSGQEDVSNLKCLEQEVRKVTLEKTSNATIQPSRSRYTSTKPYGRLQNGLPFVVYRLLLYCDDFQKSSQMSKPGSAGGCYFLPLSLPVEKRRSLSAVRIISLTPPSVSSNDVLHYIIPDLVHATIHGVEGRTPSGKKLRIFLDVLGFVGDYPASASVIDVIGHIGRSPCTLCSFRRLPNGTTNRSKYGYTTKVHSRSSSFLRILERHSSLRQSKIPDADAKRLGMVANSRSSDRECPLLCFQKALHLHRGRSALREDGRPVIQCMFDAYRSNVVAADHLLTGLAKDILKATFQVLPSKDFRVEADIQICSALRANGLLHQREIFNHTKKTLHSMTLSEVFCVLVVSVPVLKNMIKSFPQSHLIQTCHSLLTKLQALVAYTYWWPQEDLDGDEAFRIIRENKQSYFSDLRKLSKNYVECVDKLCKKSYEIGGLLDKPNLHRLIELYEHTIPAYGHIREVMELIFEAAHQPLKRSINRSNNHRSHIFAVEQCVGNDWQGRLAYVTRELQSEDETARSKAKRGMRRLLLGEQADLLDEVRNSSFITKCDNLLEKLFVPSVKTQFTKDNLISNFGTSHISEWRARLRTTLDVLEGLSGVETSILLRIVTLSKRWIEAQYPTQPPSGNERALSLELFKVARRVKRNEFGAKVGRPYGYDSINSNCAVIVQLEEHIAKRKLIVPKSGRAAKRPFFFAILGILARGDEDPWALCFKCTKRGEILRMNTPVDPDSFQLLQLTANVRRVGIYHKCQHDGNSHMGCRIDRQQRDVVHSDTLLGGATFFFQCRAHGFPPRMA